MRRAVEAGARWSDALDELEREAGAPIVPGELARWCAEVRASLRHLRHRGENHLDWQASARRQTLRKDLALAAPVEDLRERGRAARRQMVDLEEELGSLLRDAEDTHLGDGKTMRIGQRLRLEVLAWIVGERARDRELTAWLHEAYVRDHGVVD